ncbi:MAG: DUF445 domain-containing protein [Gallionella sp.]|nr:DUF445 domain-containing protein [Gallionella sp.]MDD4947090.1 DUF445 domain-containing protein [Gallionella sp.]MDD5611894.1 DUF445 domain-containing protein [Gallionella sp.]
MTDIAKRAMQTESHLRQRELDRMKWLAAGLLGFAAALDVLAQVQGWGYLRAFAEAAMIGALADWFAVVALFRHPLGLPIPHTAIIPRNKRSLANSLADFVVEHFLRAETIALRLNRYDAASHLSQWLAEQSNRRKVAGYLNQAVAYGVRVLDDKRIHDFLAVAVRHRVQAMDLSGLISDGLQLVTRDCRHHRIVHGGLHRFADYLEHPDNAERIAAFVKGWSESSWIQNMIEPFVPAISAAVARKLRALAEDESSIIYREFDEQVDVYLQRLQLEPEFRDRVNGYKERLLEHPEYARQIESLWKQLRDWVVLDLSRPDSVISLRIENLVGELEQHLLENEDLRSWLNEQIQAALIRTANANKGMVGELIREELIKWDDKYLVEKLELYLGRDLQFIRLNGTLVGGLFGLLIYAASHFAGL